MWYLAPFALSFSHSYETIGKMPPSILLFMDGDSAIKVFSCFHFLFLSLFWKYLAYVWKYGGFSLDIL